MGILQRLFKWAKTKVERCPYCNKWIPKHKLKDHKSKCKKEQKKERKRAKERRRREKRLR